MKKLFSLFLLCTTSLLFAADKAATVSRDTDLFSKPFKDAEIITELSAKTAITILKRKGGWYEIKTSEKQGWVRLTHVRLVRKGKGNQNDNSGVGEILSSLATGREKSDQVTTATAVKGLSEEELSNAEPDVDALNALDSFAVDENANNESGLATRKVDYLEGDSPTAKAEPETNSEDDE